MDNLNSKEEVENVKNKILENMRKLKRYSPELKVEHKHGPDAKMKNHDEMQRINREKAEELSEPNRLDINQ